MNGWIKLHRRLLESSLFDDPQILKLWLWCLLKANHKPSKVLVEKQEVSLKPGQFVTGRFSLADEYNRGLSKSKKVSPDSLWRWLRKLEKWQKLHIKSTSKYSIVTVLNWGDYQQDAQQMHNRCTTDAQQMHTDKNVKNEKNDKKRYREYVYLTDEEWQKLKDKFGESTAEDYIDRLNDYIGSKGKKYKSHYHTILTWNRKDEPTRKATPNYNFEF